MMAKRHIFVCAGCDLLAESSRSHATTCSPACRVRAHRSGELKRLQQFISSNGGGPTTAEVLQSMAIDRLAPELGAPIMAGTINASDIQRALCNAFDKVLHTQMKQSAEAA
jgi:hypothetical protein